MIIVYIPVDYDSEKLEELVKDLKKYSLHHLNHVETKVRRVRTILDFGDSEYPMDSSQWKQAVAFFNENKPLLGVELHMKNYLHFDGILVKHKYNEIAFVLDEPNMKSMNIELSDELKNRMGK